MTASWIRGSNRAKPEDPQGTGRLEVEGSSDSEAAGDRQGQELSGHCERPALWGCSLQPLVTQPARILAHSRAACGTLRPWVLAMGTLRGRRQNMALSARQGICHSQQPSRRSTGPPRRPPTPEPRRGWQPGPRMLPSLPREQGVVSLSQPPHPSVLPGRAG